MPPKSIGSLRKGIGHAAVAGEYERLADEDEQAARLLIEQHHYRHATYFVVQSMEKRVRHSIFSMVNAGQVYYRDQTRTHDLEDLLEFLIQIVTADPITRTHVSDLLSNRVLGGHRFKTLHNNLRYPFYSDRDGAHCMLEIREQDACYALELLQRLKEFLVDIPRLIK